MKNFLRFLISSDKRSFVLIPSLSLVLALFESLAVCLLLPLLSAAGFSNSNLGMGTARVTAWFGDIFQFINDEDLLFAYAGLLILIALGRYALNSLMQQMRVRTESSFRNKLFQNLLCARYEFLSNESQAVISQVLIQEVNRISHCAMLLVQIFTSVILILTYIGLASFFSINSVLIFAIFAGGVNLLIKRIIKNPITLGEQIRQVFSQFHHILNQYMRGLKAIKISALEGFYTRQFRDISRSLESLELEFTREQSKTRLIYEVSIALSFSIGFFLLFSVLKMPAIVLVLCLLISIRLIPQIIDVQQKASQILYFLPSYQSWDRIQSNAFRLQERSFQNATSKISFKQSISLMNLEFSYRWSKNNFHLKNISAEIPFGSLVGLSGRSGSGKTTLLDLVSGILQPQSGEILIDGRLLTEFDVRQWRSQIAYLNQEAFVFEASIRENLTWGEQVASDAELWSALTKAQAADFVRALPEKLDTLVKNSGDNFSGGQKQRLALARIFLRRPALIVLDEATSHLDSYHQEALMKTLLSLKGESTILFASHSESFLKMADIILNINDGSMECAKNYSIQHLA